jgi:pyridinium-3,5-biscarboxylic acid mononucleotide sulfurtransferase
VPHPEFTVGFDLDMTLVDSRPGIAATYRELSARTGVAIDAEAAVGRLGPPLHRELARWFPPAEVEDAVSTYRALYPAHAIAPTGLLPGARESIDAVHAAGGRAYVITSKKAELAELHLNHLGLVVDGVYGTAFEEGKSEALREINALAYVGDHVADVASAVAAGVPAVGVCTGPCPAGELAAAGAEIVLADLTGFPQWLADRVLDARLAALRESLRALGRVVVAYSGGADSAFLLAAAARALGPGNVVAATAVSASLPASEREQAQALPRELGVAHLTPGTDELSRPGYRANDGDRCYFCKAELIETLAPIAARLGAVVVTGTNADDARAGFRPGIRAAEQRGARAPLRDSGLTKAQVRLASRRWGLSTWDKPAAACLSSRIAYGVEISTERLARVERAEAALRVALSAAGIAVRDLRVRDLGAAGARVEVDPAAVPELAARPELLAAVRGFASVALDPRGFRSGSLNEVLPQHFR